MTKSFREKTYPYLLFSFGLGATGCIPVVFIQQERNAVFLLDGTQRGGYGVNSLNEAYALFPSLTPTDFMEINFKDKVPDSFEALQIAPAKMLYVSNYDGSVFLFPRETFEKLSHSLNTMLKAHPETANTHIPLYLDDKAWGRLAAGVSKNDDKSLCINVTPAFLASFSLRELKFTLQHEGVHVLRLLQNRRSQMSFHQSEFDADSLGANPIPHKPDTWDYPAAALSIVSMLRVGNPDDYFTHPRHRDRIRAIVEDFAANAELPDDLRRKQFQEMQQVSGELKRLQSDARYADYFIDEPDFDIMKIYHEAFAKRLVREKLKQSPPDTLSR